MSAEQLTPEGVDGARRARVRVRAGPADPAVPDRAGGRRHRVPPGSAWDARRTDRRVYAEPAVLDARRVRVRRRSSRWSRPPRRCYGPYRWGRYDMLVLPPSFPFGGMENPRLTFATPTVLAGDRSLVIARRARAGALLVRQPRDQRHLARLLAERRVHDLLREPDHGAALRTRARADAPGDRAPGARRGSRAATPARRGRRCSTPTTRGATPMRASPRCRTARERRSSGMLERQFGRERFDAVAAVVLRSARVRVDDNGGSSWRICVRRSSGTTRRSSGRCASANGFSSRACRRMTCRRRPCARCRRRAGSPVSREGTPPASLDTTAWVTQQWQRFLCGTARAR